MKKEEWHSVGYGFSILALKTKYKLRNDKTGEVVTPAGPAGMDNLMMAVYYKKVPNYIYHCFPAEQTAHVPDREIY